MNDLTRAGSKISVRVSKLTENSTCPNNTTYEDSERASTINCLLIKPDVIGAPKSENENKIRENARIV